jgi:hypothetical protein
LFVCPPRPDQPLIDFVERKFAHSLRFGFADDDRTRFAKTLNDERILLRCRSVDKCERARRRQHFVRRVDVVFDKDRDAVHHRARFPTLTLFVESIGYRQRIGVNLDDRSQLSVELLDPLEIHFDKST